MFVKHYCPILWVVKIVLLHILHFIVYFQSNSDLEPLRQAIEQIEDDPDQIPDTLLQVLLSLLLYQVNCQLTEIFKH